MSEMRTINCPSCETVNQPLAAVDGIQEFRCRDCGLVYYGPCGCDTTHAAAADKDVSVEANEARLAGDWQMTRPPVDARDKAAVQVYPGC